MFLKCRYRCDYLQHFQNITKCLFLNVAIGVIILFSDILYNATKSFWMPLKSNIWQRFSKRCSRFIVTTLLRHFLTSQKNITIDYSDVFGFLVTFLKCHINPDFLWCLSNPKSQTTLMQFWHQRFMTIRGLWLQIK